MIELVFVVCLKLMTSQCEERSLAYLSHEVSLFSCMTLAQPQLAKWAEGHPDLTIARWHCRTAGAGGIKA